MPANGHANINKIDGRTRYRLCQWLDAQRDRIARMDLMAPTLAEEATKELGTRITTSNIRGSCKVIGLVLPLEAKRQANRAAEERQAAFVNSLPALVQQILARLDRIEKGLDLPPI